MAILGFPRGVIWAHYRTGGRQAKTLARIGWQIAISRQPLPPNVL
jgi:hypothetical protein